MIPKRKIEKVVDQVFLSHGRRETDRTILVSPNIDSILWRALAAMFAWAFLSWLCHPL